MAKGIDQQREGGRGLAKVKLPTRLDLAQDAARALDGMPGLIIANWVDARL